MTEQARVMPPTDAEIKGAKALIAKSEEGEKLTEEEEDCVQSYHEWIHLGEKLVPWKRVCQLFDNPRLQERHPGWKNVLDTCAIFNFEGMNYDDVSKTPSSRDGAEVLCPLPFPTIAVCHNWQFFAVDEFWCSEEDDTMGANLLNIVCPFPQHKGQFETALSGRVTIDFSLPADEGVGTSVENFSGSKLLNGNPTFVVDEERAQGLSERRKG